MAKKEVQLSRRLSSRSEDSVTSYQPNTWMAGLESVIFLPQKADGTAVMTTVRDLSRPATRTMILLNGLSSSTTAKSRSTSFHMVMDGSGLSSNHRTSTGTITVAHKSEWLQSPAEVEAVIPSNLWTVAALQKTHTSLGPRLLGALSTLNLTIPVLEITSILIKAVMFTSDD